MNIWQELPRPFFVMAPLEGVADTVFRQIIASIAKPDLFVTEFTSADGLCSRGKDIVSQNVRFSLSEQPIIVQLWGKNPETMYEAAHAVSRMGFSGIDINMGCPDRAVMRSGCGAAMIDTPDSVKEVIDAVKKGSNGLPVSVKTRLGNKRIIDSWIPFLLEQDVDALTIHGRTVAELSKVPAHWDEIGKVVEMRNRFKCNTVIIGNGDVKDREEALDKAKTYGVDGVMIGRGIFQNLWAFDPNGHIASPRELLDIMVLHIKLFDTTWGNQKNYAGIKKFYKMYMNGFHDATSWRDRFMATNTPQEALGLAKELRTCL